MKNPIPYEEIIKFPNFAHLSREDYEKHIAFVQKAHERKKKVVHSDSEQNSLIKFIFAPDPNTGVPRSDLAFSMSKDTSPEVAQFIRDTLQRPIETGERTDDVDLALDSVKSRSESLTQYADRLREIISKDKQ